MYILAVIREGLSEEVVLSTDMRDTRECALSVSGVTLVRS